MVAKIGILLGLALVACGGTASHTVRNGAVTAPAAQPLRLEKIRFFDSDFAYFERAGSASARALLVPEPHLEQALDTLVVLNGGVARAPRLDFASVDPGELARKEASLPGERSLVEYQNLLVSLEGAEIEYTARSQRTQGRLVKVRLAPPVPYADPGPDDPKFLESTLDDLYLLVMGDDGIERVRASDAAPIRPVDPARRSLLDRAAKEGTVAGKARELALDLVESGGPLRIGYIAEAPAFRASYRLALAASGAAAALTGSALVRNDTDEAWTNVSASFSSARPVLAPKPGRGDARKPAPAGSFHYDGSGSVTIRAHGSGLVPFLDARVESRPLVWFGAPKALGKRGVRLANPTAQSFPEGKLAVFADRGYAGEGTLPRLEPGATALVTYGDELDVSLAMPANERTRRALRATFDGDVLELTTAERHERKYTIENRKAEPVRVEVGLGVRLPAQATGFDVFNADASPSGGFDVAGKQTATRSVVIETEVVTSTQVDGAVVDELREAAASTALAAPVRAALERSAQLMEQSARNAELAAKAEEQATEVESRASSTRSDLAGLAKESAPAAQLLVNRLEAYEREWERLTERARTLLAENQRLVEVARSELRRLPKQGPAAR